jgi:hypothetical protein
MIVHPFKNTFRDHDFSPIIDVVKEYFTENTPERLTSETFASSARYKKLGELVNSEFLDKKAYSQKWGKLTSHLKKELKKSVSGTPILENAAFSGDVTIENNIQADFIRKKHLQFHISTVGSFFSIYGVDRCTAVLPMKTPRGTDDMGNFQATLAVTVSPIFEYEEMFRKLEDELRSFFPGYLFVPYRIGMSTIENISIEEERHTGHPIDTIYEALFGQWSVQTCLTRGDEWYGMDDWLRPLDKKEKSVLDVISEHILNASPEKTIHKVWKLKESKRLPNLNVSGNIMFGMDMFDVVDFTDKKTLITIDAKRGAPETGEYKIVGDRINMDSPVSFRIADLTEDTLTLCLIFNFSESDVSIKGEAMEYKFIRMKKME